MLNWWRSHWTLTKSLIYCWRLLRRCGRHLRPRRRSHWTHWPRHTHSTGDRIDRLKVIRSNISSKIISGKPFDLKEIDQKQYWVDRKNSEIKQNIQYWANKYNQEKNWHTI